MKISQKLENACRVLAQLARHTEPGTVTRLDFLADQEGVSASFLVQILNELKRSGIVESKRGKAGGYFLPRPADTITLYDIVEAIEPSLLSSSTSTEGQSGRAVHSAWTAAGEALNAQLRSTTLATLAADEEPMYFI